MKLLHLSDLHFGPFYSPQAGAAAVRFAHEQPSDLIVISGDFTQRAKRRQFQDAAEFITQLPKTPKLVMPGNHDVPLYRVLERLFSPYSLYREHINKELEAVVSFPGATLVGLNSTAPLRAVTNGRIRQRQLDLCAEAFTKAPASDARIVVAHHHFAPAPDYEKAEFMPHSRETLRFFETVGVDMILGGHLHRAYIGSSLDVVPGAKRGIIVVQCGTTTSRRGRARERERNSLNTLHIEKHYVRIVHYMLSDGQAEFTAMSDHRFPRPGASLLVDEWNAPEIVPTSPAV